MSRFAAEVSRNNGTNKRDGTRARISRPGHCPVPVGVPFCPADVPNRRSHAKAVWTALNADFDVALFGLDKDWITAWVAHRSRAHGAGSWRVCWSRVEHRFARSSELLGMQSKQPNLDALVEARIQATLAACASFCPLCQAQHTLSQRRSPA